MEVYQAPNSYKKSYKDIVFLAGSIEMGAAEDWQTIVTKMLDDFDIGILNPRRDDWDSTWVQDKGCPQFYEQVTWELEALDDADLIIMYFVPGTNSPISLLELGLCAQSNKLIVGCPDGFYRRGNVQIVCEKYDVELYDTLDSLIDAARHFLCALQGLAE
jgi:hypothetical protein